MIGEIFLLAVRAAKSYDPAKGAARPWLFGIAHNALRNHARAELRRLKAKAALATQGRQGGGIDTDLHDVDSRVDSSRLEPVLAAALSSLPTSQREVLLLNAWGGLSPAEIAVALRVRPPTVRSRLSKARAHLRERLEQSGQVVSEDNF